MPGGNEISPNCPRRIEKSLEFYLTIAKYVGIGGTAVPVFRQEILKHLIPISTRKIDRVDRDVQVFTYAEGVGDVVFPITAAVIRRFVPVLHEQGRAFEPGAFDA